MVALCRPRTTGEEEATAMARPTTREDASAKPAPPSIGLAEAAARLGVHYMTAYRYIRTGRLRAMKSGGEWRLEVADVNRLGAPRGAAPIRAGRRSWATSRLLDRLLAGDEAGAWNVIEAALASGAEPAEIHLELLVPALRKLGEQWEGGSIDVGDEHRASLVARRLISRLGPRFNRRGRKRGVVLLGAVAGERHEIPCALVADQLRGAGFEVVDLGADTPAESFVTAARRLDPVCVLLSITGPQHEAAVAESVAAVRAATRCPVLVGGAAVPDEEMALALGSDRWTGVDARQAVLVVEGLRAGS